MNYPTVCVAVLAAMSLMACNKQEAAPAATVAASAAAVVASAATPTAPANAAGKATYNKVCVMCHASGVAGAPKPGDAADWAQRMAQGEEVVFKHAIEGFTGSKGMMPARGGGATLSDDEIKAAVRYMVDASR